MAGRSSREFRPGGHVSRRTLRDGGRSPGQGSRYARLQPSPDASSAPAGAPSSAPGPRRAYWAGEHDLSGEGFLVTPDRWTELLFTADRIDVVARKARQRLSACARIGPLRSSLRLTAAGRVHCVAIRLEPWTAMAFVPAPLRRGPWGDGGPGFPGRERDIVRAIARRAWPEVLARFDALLLELLADLSVRTRDVALACAARVGGARRGVRHLAKGC